MGPHGRLNSDVPLTTAEWLIPAEKAEGALFWSFNTAHIADTPTDWPRLLSFAKLWKSCLHLPGKELFPLGYSYNPKEFMKSEENLYPCLPAVFIAPKAFIPKHFLLCGFWCTLHVCEAQREQGGHLLNWTNYTSLQALHVFLKRRPRSARSKQGPISGCCRFQLNKVTFSPNHVTSQFKFHFICYIISALLFI